MNNVIKLLFVFIAINLLANNTQAQLSHLTRVVLPIY